jgi:hypothetical protein
MLNSEYPEIDVSGSRLTDTVDAHSDGLFGG